MDSNHLKPKGLAEIRERIVEVVSKSGGHLASSLGAVDLTIALHYVFDAPKDKIIWDVGHQTYPHKILTGRRQRMGTLRQKGGIAGFPKRDESEYDAFGTGHSSTSISAALGMAIAVYGINQIYSGGTARGIVSPGFREFFNYRIGGAVPVLALAFVGLAALGLLVQRFTRYGRSLYLIGSNPEAARLAGLPIARLTVATYAVSGLFASLAGLALLARSGVSSTFAGRGFEFDVLAAVVLGGTTFEGGRGGIGGTIAGVLVLVLAFNLVNITGLNYNMQLTVKGAIIILASALHAYLKDKR